MTDAAKKNLKVLQYAVQDAILQAQAMANVVGLEVGRPLSLTSSNGAPDVMPMREHAVMLKSVSPRQARLNSHSESM